MSRLLDIQVKNVAFIGAGILIAGYGYALYTFAKRSLESRVPEKWRKVGEVSDLICYPVKSCGSIRISEFNCTQIGIENKTIRDRVFMVVKSNFKFITGVSHLKLLQVMPTIDGDIMTLAAPGMESLEIDMKKLYNIPTVKANVWNQTVDIIDVGEEAAQWFSRFILNQDSGMRLVFYPQTFPTRDVQEENKIFDTSFPEDTGALHNVTSYMLINQASVDDLNLRLKVPITPLQLRPNIVVKGPRAFDEDTWKWVKIGDHTIFRNVRPCGRCTMINVNPESGQKIPENDPLKTLKGYRKFPKTRESPVMGIHLGICEFGLLRIGDSVFVEEILEIQSEEALYIGAGVLISAGYACAAINFLKRAYSNRIPKRWRKVGEVSDLICYPLKSCRWVRVDSFDCTQIGIEKGSMRDRVFMVVRPNGNFVTAVAYPSLFEVLPTVKGDTMILSAPNMEDIDINMDKLHTNLKTKAIVWTQTVDVIDVGDEVAEWLSRFVLKEDSGLRLVYYSQTFPTRSVREKNAVFETAIADDTGALHNTTSYMLINEASVADLSSKIDKSLLPLQFRPNIVVKGPKAFDEDAWKWVKIGDHTIFRNVKPCGRCPLINIDPETAQKDPEQTPLKTLKKYRLFPKTGESPVMGIHLGVRKYGPLRLGDSVFVEED